MFEKSKSTKFGVCFFSQSWQEQISDPHPSASQNWSHRHNDAGVHENSFIQFETEIMTYF